MIIIPVSMDMVDRSMKRAEELKEFYKLNPTSIRRGSGLVDAYLGEEVALKFIPDSELVCHNKDFDILYKEKIRIDVKTKKCRSIPRGHYNCSVAEHNPNQKCDYYVFVRIFYSGDKPITGFYLGSIKKDRFYEIGSWENKDVEDTNKVNGKNWKAPTAHFFVPIKKLRQPGEILR